MEDLFIKLFNTKNKIIKHLYDSIEDYSLTPYYFLYKGLQYEFGIYKKLNLNYALEFYKQGGNLNNHFCYYRLHIIYLNSGESSLTQSNISNENLSLFYLLKFLCYYDKFSFLNYLIPEGKLNNFKLIIKSNTEILKNLIQSNQNDLLLSQREVNFLSIYLNKNDVSYLSSLIEFYKNSKHEEALYHIFTFLSETHQIEYIEKILKENFIFNSNIKIYSLLINTFNSNKYNLQSVTLLEKNIQQVKTQLKVGGYFNLYAQLKSNLIKYEDLFSYSVPDPKENDLIINLNKIIKYLYKSATSGDADAIPQLFYSIVFTSKYMGQYDVYYYESSILESIYDLIQNEMFESHKESQFIQVLFNFRGIKMKKNYYKTKEILLNLLNSEGNEKNNELMILYYLTKCCYKLYDNELFIFYSNVLREKINNYNYKLEVTNIQCNYLIAKFLLINEKEIDKSYEILNHTLLNYKNQISSCIESNFFTFKFTITDKIFLSKIKKLLDVRKEFEKLISTNINKTLIYDIKCVYCDIRDKEVIGVPCGHKFICNQCYEQKEADLFNKDDILCSKCEMKIESGLKKVFN